MKNDNKENRLLIDQLAANTVELLNQHWKQAETLALGTDELKIGVIHSIRIAPEGGYSAESTIGFGRRIKASVKHIVNPDQMEIPLEKEVKPKRTALK